MDDLVVVVVLDDESDLGRARGIARTGPSTFDLDYRELRIDLVLCPTPRFPKKVARVARVQLDLEPKWPIYNIDCELGLARGAS